MKNPWGTHEDASGPCRAATRTRDPRQNARWLPGRMIFPNPDGRMFSENAMLAVSDRLGRGHVAVHEFRSAFAAKS